MTFQETILSVRRRPRLCAALKAISLFAVLLSVAVFVEIALRAYLLSWTSLLSFAVITAVPFIAVTLFRRLINAPRPYELYGISDAPHHRAGHSFPSRHLFSIFLIGTVGCFLSPLSAILLVFGLLLGAARVLLGIHFVRDVVAGAAIGVISGVVGVLILSPFAA